MNKFFVLFGLLLSAQAFAIGGSTTTDEYGNKGCNLSGDPYYCYCQNLGYPTGTYICSSCGTTDGSACKYGSMSGTVGPRKAAKKSNLSTH